MPDHPSRRGFSLVEVLISMGLALVIIGTVYAGFDVSMQSITTAERLALENRLITAGMFIALEETDTWRAMDRPDHRPLRTDPGGWKGIDPWSGGYDPQGADWDQLPQPFNALGDAWPASGAAAAYDPDAWYPHNPATWYRGDPGYYLHNYQSAENGDFTWRKRTDESAYGNWALFANARDQVRVAAGATATVPVAHTWLANQHKGLKYALGFYGWFDYLPANAVIDYYDVDANGRGIQPYEIRYQATGDDVGSVMALRNHGRLALPLDYSPHETQTEQRSGGERPTTRGVYLHGLTAGVAAAPAGADAQTRQELHVVNRTIVNGYSVQGEGKKWQYRDLWSMLLSEQQRQEVAIMDAAPDHWPTIEVGVRRFMKWGGIYTWCFVKIVDPISGENREIHFPAIGTTLRGARLDRGLDAP